MVVQQAVVNLHNGGGRPHPWTTYDDEGANSPRVPGRLHLIHKLEVWVDGHKWLPDDQYLWVPIGLLVWQMAISMYQN